jgi:CheY-like chemotaxis protein
VARVAVYSPDLMFGSSMLELLKGGGHDGVLCEDGEALARCLAEHPARVLIADVTADALARLELVGRARATGSLDGMGTVAVYSHVDGDARTIAEEAGFDLVVPRSRMTREGADLIERVLA